MTGDPTPFYATMNVAIGGAIGAAGRYQLGRAIAQFTSLNNAFPWATLAVNVIGCVAMGLLAGWLAKSDGNTESLRLLLGVGLLGGFTTFSAFSLEMMQLIQRGSAGLAISYAGISVLAGLAALYLGLVITRGAA